MCITFLLTRGKPGLTENQQREAENSPSPLLCLLPPLRIEIISVWILAADISSKLFCFLSLSLAFSECRKTAAEWAS